jgi:hypothetical protein
MAGKNCRHVRQALHLSEFRRTLKNRALFACEVRPPSGLFRLSGAREEP